MILLVTGSEGFIGSHLVERLLKEGHNVRAFVQYNSFSNKGWLNSINSDNLEIFFGDIRDFQSVKSALDGVTKVFHLAALISIPYSYDNSVSYIQTNIIGTYNILQASKEIAQIKNIIITSTSEVYGSAKFIPMTEEHPLQAQSPYSATKIAADKLSESYHRSFGLPITIIRPFNTYGPRQSTRAVIPRIITQLLENPNDVRLGSLTPIRDFNYVKDVVEAFVLISNSENAIGKEINIATGIGATIQDVLSIISKQMGVNFNLGTDNSRIRPKESEVDRLIGSAELLKSITNWQPQTSLEDGLRETIDFYKKNRVESDDFIK
jgi:NAD dependent epimerase/dehydratase